MTLNPSHHSVLPPRPGGKPYRGRSSQRVPSRVVVFCVCGVFTCVSSPNPPSNPPREAGTISITHSIDGEVEAQRERPASVVSVGGLRRVYRLRCSSGGSRLGNSSVL